jgi:Zn-dependent protease with chaperone function
MARDWTHEEFAAYVARLEAQADQDPVAYRSRVSLWIWLGYGFIVVLLLGTLALLAGTLYLLISGAARGGGLIKIALFLGIFAFTLLASLWVKIDRPDGYPLSRAEAPKLFEMIDRLRMRLEAPPFSQVFLDGEFNAAAAQRPRFGLLGGQENFLIVGLPLMQALSKEQFEAVMAHELGHLRGGHGAFGSRVYRIFSTWARLAESGTGVLRGFASWYFPRLNAWTFPLRRQDEYEADRGAAEATSPRTIADALCMLRVGGRQLEKNYWQPLQSRQHLLEAPPRILSEQSHVLRTTPLSDDEAQRSLRDALLEDTTYDDSHPSLKDRLTALKQEGRVPEHPGTSAAEALLGESLPRLTELLDALWQKESASGWAEARQQARESFARFEELDQKKRAGIALSDEDALAHAALTEQYRGEDEALPLYRALLDSPGEGVDAHYHVGRILTERDDPEGPPLLEQAMARRPAVAGAILPLLRLYHKRRGDEAVAASLHTRELRHADALSDAATERSQLVPKDTLLAHSLSEKELAELREKLLAVEDLGEAYLLEKKVTHFTEEGKFYVLVFTLKKKFRTDSNKDWQKLWQVVDEAVPYPVIGIVGDFAWLGKRVRELPEACVVG